MIDYANTFPTAINLRIGYRNGAWNGFVRQRYLGRRAIDSTYTTARIANNSIPAISYTDVSLAYASVAGLDGLEIFATVNNLFDRAPPTGVVTLGTQGIPTFFGVYDVVGRMYTLGIRYQR
jgi:outer membrane receptor protein involved in Fe transport